VILCPRHNRDFDADCATCTFIRGTEEALIEQRVRARCAENNPTCRTCFPSRDEKRRRFHPATPVGPAPRRPLRPEAKPPGLLAGLAPPSLRLGLRLLAPWAFTALLALAALAGRC
jgi:hypothetical protein